MNKSDRGKIKPGMMFFAGKGGVGKSTVSALVSLAKSRISRSTLLVSMDPAHNQSDIFKTELSEKPKKILDNLWIREVSTERWIKRYLKDTEENISRRYNYHKAFSLKNYFKVWQFSPGIEEYALLQAFESILAENQDKEFIVFDMPPTALTLRFFSLPAMTLAWIGELIKLREKIHQKKEIISNIRIGKKNLETDPVLSKLRQMEHNYRKLNRLFTSRETAIHLVVKPDELSRAESIRIFKKLDEIDKSVGNLVLNTCNDPDLLKSYQKLIGADQYIMLPESSVPLIGLENLDKYIGPLKDEWDKF
jgi:arsenite-transporting ATPase